MPTVSAMHGLSAGAINPLRIYTWSSDVPLAPTRQSSVVRLKAQAA